MELSNNFVILILSLIVFLSIIVYYNKKEKQVEGFNIAGEAKKIGKQIISPIEKGLKDTIGKVAKGVTSLANSVADALKQIGSIKTTIVDMIKKIGDFFKKVGNAIAKIGVIIYEGIIKPMSGFFIALGNIFVQIALILFEIIKKIISLPNCMPIYMYHGGKAVANTMYKQYVPGSIRWVISMLFLAITLPLYYLFVLPLELVLNMFGTSVVKPFNKMFDSTACYKFDVKPKVTSMKNGFTDAAKNFSKAFGKMDWGSIWK